MMADTNPRKRLAAIDLKIAEWSPWPETARLVHEDGRRTGVWIWDRAAVESQMGAAGLRVDRVTVLPETALQPRGTDGLRHVKTFDGSEGQWWVDGLLAASRWWPEPPDESEWVRFQRAAGVPPEAALGQADLPESLRELSRPWLSGSTFLRSGRSGGVRVVPAYWALASAYVLLLGLFAGQSLGDQITLSQIDSDMASATAAAQPRMAERAEARNGLDAVNRLQTLAPYPSQLELWVKVSEIVPRNGTKVINWNFQTGELEFTLVAPTGVNAPAYVKALQTVVGFTNVSAEPVGDDKVLHVKLKVAPR